MRFRFLLLLGLSATAFAGTQIVDTIQTPFVGVPFSGKVTISGPKMTNAAGQTIVQWQSDYNVSSGAFSVTLEPNDSATPSGTSYSVRYSPAPTLRGAPWTETWVVPTSAAPLKINQVRVMSQPAPGLIILPQQIAGSGASQGQCLAWTGSAYQPLDCLASARGDIADSVGTVSVVGIQGIPVAPGTPSDGQYLRYNAATARWERVSFVDQEVPSGTIDGTNNVFTLLNSPSPPAGMVLFRNGIAQKLGFDYTLSEGTITFLTGATPQADDVLVTWYRY